jgi:chorismate synthase
MMQMRDVIFRQHSRIRRRGHDARPIVVRFAVKPTSSIITPRETVTTANQNTEVITKGRHDPCVGIRAVPIGEAMMAVTLADHFLRHRGQTGRDGGIGY